MILLKEIPESELYCFTEKFYPVFANIDWLIFKNKNTEEKKEILRTIIKRAMEGAADGNQLDRVYG